MSALPIRLQLLGLILSLNALFIISLEDHTQEEKLIGWKGERRDHGAYSVAAEGDLTPWIEVISWEPRVHLYHNFLTPRECLHLIHKAGPHMAKSTVVDSKTGGRKDSRSRTSSGAFLSRGEDDIVKAIEKRISEFTFVPVEHGEPLHILRYQATQKYEAHYDYFHDSVSTRNGGQRMATVLMYLSNVEEGGETIFPAIEPNSSAPGFSSLSACGKQGLAVRPRRGDALLFWSMKPNTKLDPKSLHAGCPVIKGNKWSATKWIRVSEYKV